MSNISVGGLDELIDAVAQAEALKRHRKSLMASLSGNQQTDLAILEQIEAIEEQLDGLGME